MIGSPDVSSKFGYFFGRGIAAGPVRVCVDIVGARGNAGGRIDEAVGAVARERGCESERVRARCLGAGAGGP